VSALLPVLRDASSVVRVAHVCGTDLDPQDRAAIVAALEAAGVLVASSNAEATRWAARAAHLAGAPAGKGVR
jgi:FdrA protein